MIGDKKTRKTRKVSKKVKKMHEEAVSKGLLGATAPVSETKGGGMFTVYRVDVVKDGDESKVDSSNLYNDLNVGFISLKNMMDTLESKNGYHYRIEKADFGKPTIVYKFKTV